MLSNVQRGTAIPLHQNIDNRGGGLRVGLRSLIYTVGWYNVESGESFSWRSVGGPTSTVDIYPGLYGFTQLKDITEASSRAATLTVNKVNGLVTLTVANGWEVLLTDRLLSMLGLGHGLGGAWLDTGTYTGDRPVDFATRKMLKVHLEQINFTGNVDDGGPSTLLACIGVGCHSFGEIHTVRFEHPEYKRLQGDLVHVLKVEIKDETGRSIDNHDLPIYLTLEIIA